MTVTPGGVALAKSSSRAGPWSELGALGVLQGFIHELRASGIPISTTEDLDAMRALAHISLSDRQATRCALATTMVKRRGHLATFDSVFDLYFGLVSAPRGDTDEDGDDDGNRADGSPGTSDFDVDDIAAAVFAALAGLSGQDFEAELRRLVALAVDRFGGIEPGRPIGGTYAIYRTMRHLGADGLLAQLLGHISHADAAHDDAPVEENGDGDPSADATNESLADRLKREEMERRVALLRRLVEAEVRRRLIADRGAEAMARSLRRGVPEEIDFMHASREEMREIQAAIGPLARAMAARLAQQRRHRHRGRLDMRATVRRSLGTGGVLAEPVFKSPRPARPEIMVLADISGSVASFSRFTLLFVYAMADQFSKVRSWVFIDGIDEVTHMLAGASDVAAAMSRVSTQADAVWADGHSNYGHALEVFHERHAREITPRTSIILLGDARNNYHQSSSWVLDELQRRARRVYWLNPEPRGHWDSGDSIISTYLEFCDGSFECQNLRQLERFVRSISDP